MAKNKGGRPVIFVGEVIRKLEEAFAIDATVDEACFYANISRQNYYDHVKGGEGATEEQQKLFDRFQELRERPVLLARQTVVKKIPESYQNAMDYLRRKRRNEFAEKKEVELSGEVTISKVLDELENE